MKEISVGLVGATGMVGLQFLRILREKNFNIKNLYLFASARTAGRKIKFAGKEIIVEELTESSFDREMDYAFFCASGTISEKFAPIAASKGVVVIDNSSHFRLHDDVPLIVPEVNPHAVVGHKNIIANPNCSTAQAVVVLKPIDKHYGIKRVVISTYQAVSGAGKEGIQDLVTGNAKTSWQTQRLQDAMNDPDHEMNPINLLAPHHKYELQAMSTYIAGNVIPLIGDIDPETGYGPEETKLINETRKILERPDLKITATAVRVPVINGHSESINLELEKSFQLDAIKMLLNSSPGIELSDVPQPLAASGKNNVFVGRIRADLDINGINMFVVADNLRKGAALNGVQIMELLINQD